MWGAGAFDNVLSELFMWCRFVGQCWCWRTQNLAYNFKKENAKGVLGGGEGVWQMKHVAWPVLLLIIRMGKTQDDFKQCPLIRIFLPYQNGSTASMWRRNSPMKPKILPSLLREHTPNKWLSFTWCLKTGCSLWDVFVSCEVLYQLSSSTVSL